jgi:tape measure domain-containing protein
MSNTLQLSLLIKAAVEGLGNVQALIGEIDRLGGSTEDTEQQASGLASEFQHIGQNTALVDQFRQLAQEANAAKQALGQTQDEVDQLNDGFAQSGGAVQAQTRALESAQEAAQETNASYRGVTQGLQSVQTEMTATGASIAAAGQRARELADEFDRLVAEVKVVEEFRRLTQEANAAQQALDKSKTRVAELEKALSSAEAPTQAQAQALDALRKVASEADQTHQQATQDLQRFRDELARQGNVARDAGAAQFNLRAALAGTVGAIGQLEAELRQVAGALPRVGDGAAGIAAVGRSARDASTAMESLGNRGRRAGEDIADATRRAADGTDRLHESLRAAGFQLTALAGAVLGLDALKEAGAKALEVGGEFEKLKVSLETLTGSSEDAQKALDWVAEFAKNTPLQLEQVTEGFITLKNFGLDPMDGTFQKLVDATATMTNSQEKLGRITLAVGQAWSKQKLQGDEILQLIEAGIPVWDLLAKATGKNVQELQKLSESGQLGRDAIRALIDEIGRTYDGAAIKSMGTWQGLLSNLEDNWTAFLRSVADSGALDAFKAEIQTINDAVAQMTRTGELQRYAKGAADAMIVLANAIKNTVVFVHDHADALATLAKVAAGLKLGAIAADILAMATAAGAAEGALGAAALAGTRFAAALRGAGYVTIAFEIAQIVSNLVKLNELHEQEAQALKNAERNRYSFNLELQRAIQIGQQYADMQIKSADEVAKLSAQERTEYENRLNAATRFWRARAMEQEREGQSTAEAEARAKAYGDALDALGQKNVALGNKAEQAQQQGESAAAKFGAALIKAGENADNVAGKIGDLVRDFDLLKPDAVDQLALAIGRLGEASDGSAKEVRDNLGKAFADLTGPELNAELDAIRTRMEAVGPAATQLGTALDVGVRESLKRLGLDADQALGGMSRKVSEGIAALESLKGQLDASGVTGARAGTVIKQALSNLIDSAKTTSELKAVNDEITRLGQRGDLTRQQLQSAYGQIAEAQRKLGVTTQELRAAQDQARVSADELAAAVRAGTATQDQYARAAGDAREALRLQAAQAVETGASMANLAADITAREYAQASAARERQATQQQATEQAKKEKKAQDDLTSSFQDGEQALSPWASLYQQLAKFGDNFVESMRRMGRQLEGTNDWWSDLDFGAQTLARLQGKLDQVNDLTQRLGSNDLAALRDALDEATGGMLNMGDGAVTASGYLSEVGEQNLGPLNAAIAQAVARIKELERESASTLNSLRDELDQLKGNERAIEERRYQSRRADLEAAYEEAKKANNARAQSDYAESLKILDRLHARKMKALDDEAKKEKEQRAQEAEQAKQKARATEQERREQDAARQQELAARKTQARGDGPDSRNLFDADRRLEETGRSALRREQTDLTADRRLRDSLNAAARQEQTRLAVPGQTITLRLEGGGRTADVQAASEEVVQNVLQILKNAGLRTF